MAPGPSNQCPRVPHRPRAGRSCSSNSTDSRSGTQCRTDQLTGGAVTSINQIARLKAWLAEQGCIADTLDKSAIKELLKGDNLSPAVRRALELRQGGAQAAAKKIDALLARCVRDRIRGAFRYHGASTGRWAGNGVQPQNLKRPQSKTWMQRSPLFRPATTRTSANCIPSHWQSSATSADR